MVSRGRGHTAIEIGAFSETDLRPFSLLYRAGGDRTSSSPGLLHSRGWALPRSGGVDDFPSPSESADDDAAVFVTAMNRGRDLSAQESRLIATGLTAGMGSVAAYSPAARGNERM